MTRRLGAVPALVIQIPVEGRVRAFIVCGTWEEELRLGHDLLGRDVLVELGIAVADLFDLLADRAEDVLGDEEAA